MGTGKLKSCPFCKHRAKVLSTDKGMKLWFVKCIGCGIRTPHFKRQDVAIELWNTRGKE